MSRRPYLAVLGSAVLCYAALGAVLRVLPELARDRAVLGLLVGAPALTGIVSRPAGGRVADRLGPWPVVLGGAAVMAAGAVPPLLAGGTGVLLASRLMVGAGEGAMMSATVLWLLRLAGPERRGQALGHIGLANYAGLAAGPLLADALGRAEAPVLAAAVALPLGSALLAASVPRPEVERERVADSEDASTLAAVRRPGVALMLVNAGYVALLAFGGASTGTAMVVPLFAAIVIATRLLGAHVPDRLGGGRTARWSTALAAAGLAVLALPGGIGGAVAGTAVLAVGQGLAVPALGLLALSGVPAARHGAVAGAFFAFFDAGVGAGGPLAGVVARLTTPDGAMLAAAAAVAAAGLVAAPPRSSG